MKRHSATRWAALACAGLVAAVTLTACGSHDSSSVPGMNHGNASSQSGTTVNSADVTFAQQMIPHHRQAVEMADLAETRAANAQVKQLAAQIKAAQDPEIATMTKWLTTWGQPTAAPGGHNMPGMDHGMPGMMSDANLAKLKAASGADFDKQFLQMMIEHHRGAIEMARTEQTAGINPDAKALAGRIIQTQQAEIDTMQKMLTQL